MMSKLKLGSASGSKGSIFSRIPRKHFVNAFWLGMGGLSVYGIYLLLSAATPYVIGGLTTVAGYRIMKNRWRNRRK